MLIEIRLGGLVNLGFATVAITLFMACVSGREKREPPQPNSVSVGDGGGSIGGGGPGGGGGGASVGPTPSVCQCWSEENLGGACADCVSNAEAGDCAGQTAAANADPTTAEIEACIDTYGDDEVDNCATAFGNNAPWLAKWDCSCAACSAECSMGDAVMCDVHAPPEHCSCIADLITPNRECASCGVAAAGDACAAAFSDCDENIDCRNAIAYCIPNCEGLHATASCIDACKGPMASDGRALIDAYYDCLCTTGCGSICSDAPGCLGP